MQRSTSNAVLAGRQALAAIINLRTPLNEWLFYLAHPSMDRESDLRSRIFCLLVYSLLEAASEQENRVAGLRRLVARERSEPGAKLADMLDFALSAISDLLSIFTTEELVAIQVRRDAMAHGKLTHKQSDQRVYQVDNAKIVSAKYSLGRYYDGSVEVFRLYGTPGEFLTAMRSRFTHYKTLFWAFSHVFNMPSFVTCASREVEENRTDLLRVEWGTSSYLEARARYANRPDLFRSLASYRNEWGLELSPIDSVFAQYYPADFNG